MPDSEHPTRGLTVSVEILGFDEALEKLNLMVELWQEISRLSASLPEVLPYGPVPGFEVQLCGLSERSLVGPFEDI